MDVISENAREGLINEIWVLMRESIENLKEKCENKRLKVNLNKTKVMVNGSKDEVLKSKVDPWAKCNNKVIANSVM